MSYRKVGGLHFVRIGRFGFSFYVSRKVTRYRAERAMRHARVRAERHARYA